MDKVLENKLREFIRKIFQEELEEITISESLLAKVKNETNNSLLSKEE